MLPVMPPTAGDHAIGVHATQRSTKHKAEFVMACVKAFFESLSLIALAFEIASRSTNVFSSRFYEYATFVGYLNLDEETAYQTAFFVVCGGAVAFVAGFFFLSQLDVCSDVCVNEEFWLTVDEWLFGVFLIPVIKLALEMLHCNDDGYIYKVPSIECYSSEHSPYMVLAFLTLISILLGVVIHMIVDQRASHYDGQPGRLRKHATYVFGKSTAYRCLLVIFTVFSIKESAGLVLSVVALYSFIPIVAIFYSLPHIEVRYNLLLAVKYVSSSWVYCFSFFAVIGAGDEAGDDISNAEIIVFVILPFFCYGAVRAMTHLCAKNPPTAEDFQMVLPGNLQRYDDVNEAVKKAAAKYDLDVACCTRIVHATSSKDSDATSADNSCDADGVYADTSPLMKGMMDANAVARTDLQGVLLEREHLGFGTPKPPSASTVAELHRLLLLSNGTTLQWLQLTGYHIGKSFGAERSAEDEAAIVSLFASLGALTRSNLKHLSLFGCFLDDSTAEMCVRAILNATATPPASAAVSTPASASMQMPPPAYEDSFTVEVVKISPSPRASDGGTVKKDTDEVVDDKSAAVAPANIAVATPSSSAECTLRTLNLGSNSSLSPDGRDRIKQIIASSECRSFTVIF
jgi:hypothetical protein